MIVFDFEVLKYNWLVVFLDLEKREYTIIHDNKLELELYYNEHKQDVFIGYNAKNYDKYIFQGILSNFNPYLISQHIIEYKMNGYDFTNLDNEKFPLIIFDCMKLSDGGLKSLEGFMGNDIEESKISFDIDRPLTDEEMEILTNYCIHDVEQTTLIASKRYSQFETFVNLINKFNLPLTYLSSTESKLAEKILNARQQQLTSEQFNIRIPDTLNLNKYKYIAEWYLDKVNHDYSKKLEVNVANIKCIFAWGGLHGAKPKYIDKGFYCMIDVTSLYPSIMIEYDLLSRSVKGKDRELYKQIYHDRLKFKYGNEDEKQLSNAYKLVLNVTYGAMKSVYNKLYDPLNANLVCIFGQLLILDLVEQLEKELTPEFVQINTDGILIKLDESDNNKMKEIISIWEKRTRLKMDYTYFSQIIQKDVNNYIAISNDGSYKCKGAYVKKTNDLDYDLNIVNKAIKEYFVNGTPPQETINNCSNLRDFQKIIKLTSKYKAMYHNNTKLFGTVFRVFASNEIKDGCLFKCKVVKGVDKFEKVANTPLKAFICNEDINDSNISKMYIDKLDKSYYIQLAYDRIKDFGCNHNEVGQLSFNF